MTANSYKDKYKTMKLSNKKIIIFLLVAVIGIVFLAIGAELFYKWQKNNSQSKISLEVRGDQKVGDVVDIDINIDTHNSTINAAEVYLTFDPVYLEIQVVEKSDSIFPIWLGEPRFSNLEGTASFAGGLPTPGFKGRGKMGIIKAKLIKSGKTEISFSKKSRMLLNDGEGTAVPLQLGPIQLNIQ